MINLALRHGVGVAVVVLIVTIFGLISLFRVPIQMTPDLAANSISVITVWPGATPQDIEKEILIEQEKFLRSLNDLEKMTAEATTGRGEIVLEFRVGTDIEEILVRTQNALSQVPAYPENVDQPRIITSSASDQPIAWFSVRPLPGNPQNVDIVSMEDFLDERVKTELERTPGVSQSQIFGGAERQLRIYIDPAKLAERNISINQLRQALRTRNRDISGGDFDEGKRRYLLRTVGRFQSPDDVESLVIARRGGTPVYLRDVGFVEMDRAETRATVRHNGELAIAMNVRRQPGTNILKVMESVQETLARLNETILKDAGLIMRQVSDDTIYIRDSVAMVRQNLILGGILATLVLLLFLRSFKATVIGAMAVPICTISSFLGLTLAGRTVNVISLAGVAFAIGMTLDNSIVVLENIYRHRQMGKDAYTAARDGVREVWGAVLASTLTTAIVFLPIVFVQEEAGQLFQDIAIAISSAVIFSMLVAISVVPSASARFLTGIGEQGAENAWSRWLHRIGLTQLASRFQGFTLATLGWVLASTGRRLALVIFMAVASVGVAYGLAPKTEYLPDGNQNIVFAIMIPPAGYNLEEMARIGTEVETDFLPYVGQDPELFENGETEIPAIQDFFFVSMPQQIIAITKTVDPNHLDNLIPKLNERLAEVPGMIVFARRGSIFSRGLSGVRGIDLDISGPDLKDIFNVAFDAFLVVLQDLQWPNPEPKPGINLGQPLLEIRPDWDRAAELGIDAVDLGYLIWAMTDGAYVDEFFLRDDKIDMYLYSTQGTIDRIQDLQNLLIYTSQGGTVPLSSVATLQETVNTEVIRRVDRRRTVTLTIVPPVEVPLETAVEMIQTEIIDRLQREGKVPIDVSMRIAGASDKLKATREALGGNFLLAVVISYLLMVALFSHWGFPLVIMMSLPLGIVGGVFGLFLLNQFSFVFTWFGADDFYQPLDVITMLGFVVLLGTVVNNPILLVERSLQLVRDEGVAPLAAVLDSVRVRLRPIMMSTLTTMFGLLPLVVMPGAGAELYRGLGTIVLFGLFFSTLFTLTFIPCLLSLTLELGVWFKTWRTGVSPVETETVEREQPRAAAAAAPQNEPEPETAPARTQLGEA